MNFGNDYDSHFAMAAAVQSLENLVDLITARHEAGYQRGERLEEWILLGRFYLDSYGQFNKYDGHQGDDIPIVRFPDIPKVLTRDEFHTFVDRHLKLGEPFGTSCCVSWLPEGDQICPVCKKGWTIPNCYDFVVEHKDIVVDTKDFIGQTVANFKAKWNRDNHEVNWFLRGETNLKNKKYIDRTILVNKIWKAEDKHQVNELGWIETDDDHIIEPGDHLFVHLVTYRHEKCYRSRQAKLQHEYFKRIFISAGFRNVIMTQISNQYHGGDCLFCAPWYQVTADSLNFTIGRRKHVISIEMKDQKRIRLEALFRREDVTKEKELIHAWNREKCVEYLIKIRKTAVSPFWFLHQVAFWPHLIARFFKNRLDWAEILFTNPKLYWKLRFQKNKI
ncbi:MAG TPA: hypothetical protein PLI45_00040 [Candidatus Woesebacteria bacterium]|nr:hypothetical protein [Candidatus Woesebacteria bacterium]